MRHEPRLDHLALFGFQRILQCDTNQESAIEDNRFDLGTFRWCFQLSRRESLVPFHNMVRIGVSLHTHLASQEDLQTARSLHSTFFSSIFKLFHARWADRQNVCLLNLVVGYQRKGPKALSHSQDWFRTTSQPASVKLQIITWVNRCVGFCFSVSRGRDSTHLDFAAARLFLAGISTTRHWFVSSQMRSTYMSNFVFVFHFVGLCHRLRPCCSDDSDSAISSVRKPRMLSSLLTVESFIGHAVRLFHAHCALTMISFTGCSLLRKLTPTRVPATIVLSYPVEDTQERDWRERVLSRCRWYANCVASSTEARIRHGLFLEDFRHSCRFPSTPGVKVQSWCRWSFISFVSSCR